jgi:two-component system sensor histidine kinase VanS
MRTDRRPRGRWHPSARLRLTLSYAGFLVVAGGAALFGIYVVLRYVPNYPLTAADPSEVGGTVASRGQILEAVVGASGAILVALAVIGLIGGWLLAGRILRPLRAINEAARIAATGRLDHRIGLTARHDEFGELADNFDHMLDRLNDAFLMQERFAANASHELRTPLAVMGTLIEVARASPEETDYEQLLARLQATNDRAVGLTEALLRLGDANAVNAVAERFDLATVARAVADEFVEEARRHQVTLEADLRAAPITADVALVEQLVKNLTQNAIRHNRLDGVALLSTFRDPNASSVVLRVENSGALISAELATQLAEPFLRGGGRAGRGDGHRGYGLGLALVERIAAIHRGALEITPRVGGGLIATVSLPTED